MESNTPPSIVRIVNEALRRPPTVHDLEVTIGSHLIRDAVSAKEHVAVIAVAEGGGAVRCTFEVKPHAAGRRLMIHFKFGSTVPFERLRGLVEPLGLPEPSIAPPPLVSPGRPRPRACYEWIYRVGESATLKLVRDLETKDVADVYVFWTLP